jgi:PAS domain-containing protein
LLAGGGWVLVNHFILGELRGQAAYLPQVVVELAMVARVDVLLLIFQGRVARDRALLLAGEERFRGIIQSITDYVYTVRRGDGGTIVTEHGPGREAVTGFPADQLPADPYRWLSMVVPEDRDAALEQARRALAGEHIEPREFAIIASALLRPQLSCQQQSANRRQSRGQLLGVIED